MAETVILVGLQGSGKSTYFQAHLAATHVLVSGDVQGSIQKQMETVRNCLNQQRSFAVDNTNLTRTARAPFIDLAKQAGYRVSARYFEVPVRVAIGRNNYRRDKKPIPVPAILRAAK